ncbi:type IV secretory system conjugative DNA transfer family protein [Psychroserpens sp.]|uniref:type IV secretory system conjugative DNA transfer family protein n=1 Tax=Psychroserpens sp. TaxID=2020870 RepID=UPI002B26DDEA|nr:type IV secretion system DNA-binding domain-containing protein [Psychroserpens sp.]
MSKLTEKATINFYTWESRGRGYYHFENPVEIEPPYIPFVHIDTSYIEHIDDGKVTFLGGLKNLINPPQDKPNQILDVPEILPYTVDSEPKLECIEIKFPQGTEISLALMQELFNLLSFSESSFSFEILSQNDAISIQFTCSQNDYSRLTSHLKAFFPYIILKPKEALNINFDMDVPVAIADFGLDNEFMLPIAQTDSLKIDPLTSIIATLGTLDKDETAIFQVIFKGVTAPWSKDMMYSVSDGYGGSFFEAHPEFITATTEKISNSLFSAVVRIAVQGKQEEHSRYLASELSKSISSISCSTYNMLIPLSNEGYEYDDHLRNVFFRRSNRLGFILNVKELTHFVHYPNKTVVNKKLGVGEDKTKKHNNPENNGIYLGENIHLGETYPVNLDTEIRLSHNHIIGATGVGKSTLIANMMLADIKQGRGCAIFDPHGDICEDILKRIPLDRKEDVIIIDPSDSEFPVGFNLLEANTEAEKIVLSSDLVSAFKRHATAWGDNMTAVLQNVVNTILESTRGGTLIELKRFLIEENFRKEYLTSVDDPSLHYYWQNEYPLVRKGITPLLTRIDTFLRPKLVRYMLVQKQGVDIAKCLSENKIVLLKLSQGLIGEQNSYLLGSLFLAKFNQAALSRQSQSKDERSPYMLYLDEFQNFITPSIERILSGARKYGLGITIAHQELGQIQESSLLNSVLSNPKTRICFRLGDSDAKRLESGFSYFEQLDLQNLERGQAIMRVGSSSNDFNITTSLLEEVTTDYSQDFISHVRKEYAMPRLKVEQLLVSLLPNISKQKINISKQEVDVVHEEAISIPEPSKNIANEDKNLIPSTHLQEQKESYLQEVEKEELERTHRSIQNYVLTLGQQRGFITELETQTSAGGRIDVSLKKDDIHIAVEVSVTNTIEYETQNIQKCIKENYLLVYMISESKVHLKNIKRRTEEVLSDDDYKKVKFGSPSQFLSFLNTFTKKPKVKNKKVCGYRVKTNHVDVNDIEAQSKNSKIQDIILKSGSKNKNN